MRTITRPGRRSKRGVLTLAPATAVVVSSMIGTGIFTTTGLMAGAGAGGGDILLAWLIGGAVALCGALCYGELGANLPGSGGECFYLSRLMHPALGFTAGCVSLVAGFAAPVAAAAMSMHLFLGRAVAGWPVRAMAVATVLSVSLLHAYDLRLGGRVQTALAALKVLLLAGFILFVLPANAVSAAPSFSEFNPSFWLSPAFALVLIFVSFAYSGWNAAAYVGAEVRDPERNLPRSLLLGTAAVTIIYLLVNAAFLSAMPARELAGVEEAAHAVGERQWGAPVGSLVSLLIGVAQLAPISAMTLIGPRVLEAMARDNFLPGGFARLSRRGVPVRAVWAQGALASVIVVTSSFGPLLVYIGFTLSLFAALTAACLLRLRRAGLSRRRVCVGYPVTPALFIAFSLWAAVWSVSSQPLAALAGVVTLAFGLAAYAIRARSRGADVPLDVIEVKAV